MLNSLNNSKILLCDALGALVSAFFLGIILIIWNDLVGMPKQILYFLASIALLLAGFSYSLYKKKAKTWKSYLPLVAFGNISYAGLTFVLITLVYNLKLWGNIYFAIEIFLLLIIAYFELRVSRL